MASIPPPSVLEQACRMRATLEALQHALEAGDPIAVLDAEPRMAALAAAGQVDAGTVDEHDRPAIRHELVLAREALARCRVTGAAIADLASATWRATGGDAAYSSLGRPADRAAVRGRDVRTRV